MNFAAIELLKTGKFTPKALILNDDILVLVKKIIDFKFEFGNGNFFAAEFVFEFD